MIIIDTNVPPYFSQAKHFFIQIFYNINHYKLSFAIFCPLPAISCQEKWNIGISCANISIYSGWFQLELTKVDTVGNP